MERVFVIRPFGTKKDAEGREIDFDRVHRELIDPALRGAQLTGGTTGEIIDAGNIREDMFSLILEADLVVCDVTVHNANVFYELGIRHALRKRSTILVRGEPSADRIPFDLLTDRYLRYDAGTPAGTVDALVEMIRASLRADRETDSPVFRMMEGLAEANPAQVELVPLDFREEVARARAARSRGWLRLLGEDVRGQRFQWTGLKQVAQAQWALKDYAGARQTLERLPPASSGPDTNLLLANLYERLYRQERRPALLTESDQALARVLADGRATQEQRVEAQTLKARNEKTRWRNGFAGTEVSAARGRAMNQRLRDTYAEYLKAYYQDLNRFYPGVAALQMGEIFLDLSSDPAGGWKAAFDNDHEADEYRRGAEKQVGMLRQVVQTTVDAALARLDENDPEHMWAVISNADLVFLAEGSAERVVRRYGDALPADDPSACESALNQLELFSQLGFRKEIADRVLAEYAPLRAEEPKAETPLHFVVFAGHRVDEPGRTPPRFPEGLADRVRQRVREKLASLAAGHRVVGVASGAPGGDILFHEVCDELGIPSSLCLPMPADEYSRQVFMQMDGWRARFLDLHRKRADSAVLVLSDRDGLPRWLEGTAADAWERGNRWVLQMALASSADRTTLVVLWDGKPQDPGSRGGTAHMVDITREAGLVDVDPILLDEVLEPPAPTG